MLGIRTWGIKWKQGQYNSIFTFHSFDVGPQFFSRRLDVDSELVILVDLELNRVSHLEKLLFVRQACNPELVLAEN